MSYMISICILIKLKIFDWVGLGQDSRSVFVIGLRFADGASPLNTNGATRIQIVGSNSVRF